MRTLFSLMLLFVPALAWAGDNMANLAGGGAAATVATGAALIAARTAAKRKRVEKIVADLGERWHWGASRQAYEVQNLLRRGVK